MNSNIKKLSVGAIHPSKNCGFTLIELLMVVAIVAVLASLLTPSLSRSKTKGVNAACVNNLRQLGIATRIYADENRERLPSAEILPTLPIDPRNPLPRICDVLAPYAARTVGGSTNGATVFKCPADRAGRYAAEGSSYEWNAGRNGHRIDETGTDSAFLLLQRGNPAGGVTNFVVTFSPGTIPMLLDYEAFHPRPPRSGKNVVFMDGHVEPLPTSPGVSN
jgi:prepilin-type N-terminal cleavage/methylation domain-containing protein/prepilin-type processing-associated H-X9-DG protein